MPSKTGAKNDIANKDVKKDQVITLLRSLGNMVAGIAKGDRQVLVSSGFPLVKDREPALPITKPAPPVLSTGINPGEVFSVGQADAAVVARVHLFAAEPITNDTKWDSTITTNRKFTYANLESGKKYWFKQGVVGKRDQYVESDAVSYVAQ